MSSLKEYNLKLARLKNTRKLTKTMHMVSANKLRKAQEAMRKADAYNEKFMSLMHDILQAGARFEQIAVCNQRKSVKKVLVLVISSDRGLCGGFNNNLNKNVLKWIADLGPDIQTIIYTCGKKSTAYMKNRCSIDNIYDGVTMKPRFSDARKIANDLQTAFLRERADEVYIAYNSFKSVISQHPVIEKFLPVSLEKIKPAANEMPKDVIFDSNRNGMLKASIPQMISLAVFRYLLISAVGEHAARMTAMENSKNNAEKLIDTITLLRNRARQTAITNELSEIISGAEALN